jgi:dCTP deaminase
MLTGPEIKRHVEEGGIVLEPYSEDNVNPNSYNVSLGDSLLVYTVRTHRDSDNYYLDPFQRNHFDTVEIPKNGIVLEPGELYLGTTVEHTESHVAIPMINGRSSLARLGLVVHQTGGFGDLGFCGQWTLELSCVRRIKVYAGMSVAQICWFYPQQDPNNIHRMVYDGKYQGQEKPTACRYHTEVER